MISPRPTIPLKSESVWIIVIDKQVLQACADIPDSILPFKSTRDMRDACNESEYYAKIGHYQNKTVFMLIPAAHFELSGYAFAPLRALLGKVDAELFALAGRACQVAHFVATHRYCSSCAEPLQETQDELAVYCKRCDYRTYPRISPCIIVAIYRPGQILLARGARHPEGLYSVLAGFVESGESLEQTLHREVYEEVGVQVTNVRYVMSQSWPFPHSLMVGFVAEHLAGEIKIDEKEIVAADWFNFDQLPAIPPAGTIAAQLINKAIEAQR